MLEHTKLQISYIDLRDLLLLTLLIKRAYCIIIIIKYNNSHKLALKQVMNTKTIENE